MRTTAAPRSGFLMTTTAYPPSTGGVQAHVADLSRQLRRYQADIATLWRTNRTDWLLGTTLRLLPHAPATAPGDGVTTLGWTSPTRLRMLPWVLSYYAIVPLAADRLARLMAPAVEQLLRPHHVLIHNHRIGREFLALASLQIARRHGIPFVLTPHHHPKWKGYRYRAWLDVYRSADAVLAHTPAERAELMRLGVDPARIQVIWSAADDPLEGDAARFRGRFIDPQAPLIVFVGQLYAYKGIAELVAAVDLLQARGVRANLAYLGPHTPFSRRFFRHQERPWMRVLGPVSPQEKWDAIEAATVVALPSQHEAFGRIYLEAWSKAKPVVGGRIPAVADVIEDERSGLLVTPGSASELSRALERIIMDSALARELGHRGQQAVIQRFNWAHVVARVEEAYDAARRRLAERRRPSPLARPEGGPLERERPTPPR
jgi:glycosyltransferase involved in cell wall biosynthesis